MVLSTGSIKGDVRTRDFEDFHPCLAYSVYAVDAPVPVYRFLKQTKDMFSSVNLIAVPCDNARINHPVLSAVRRYSVKLGVTVLREDFVLIPFLSALG
ncbi:MAG: hypothetical protein ACLFR1_15320 [Spirochaetia bacterium]